MTRLPLLALAALLAASPLAAQKRPVRKAPKPKPAAAATPAPETAPKPAPEPPPAPKPKPRVRLDTSYGPVVVELEPDVAPGTVANFLRYVQEGHYPGTIFHRVIPDFMVQGGGYTEDLQEKPRHPGIRNEAREAAKAGLKNVRGTIAMARTEDPHSASSEFYINLVDNPRLDPGGASADGYCAFGRVVEGMEAVDRIAKVRTVWRKGMQDVPDYAVRLKGATLLPAAK